MYLTGRNIGDEYRYVLDRKRQKKFPGNMLDRPQLLLNPWAVRSTETGEQLAAGRRRRSAPRRRMRRRAADAGRSRPNDAGWPQRAAGGDFANLDFLADASAVLVNLVPDKDGVVTHRPQGHSGRTRCIHVVAVDPLAHDGAAR